MTTSLALPSPAGARSGSCGRVGKAPRNATLHELRYSILCLVNRARSNHGIPTLRFNEALRRSASGHSVDMVRRGYFAHTSFGGSVVSARISRYGYGPMAVVGENIAYGPGRRYGRANVIFDGWMHSPSHRANILHRGFREFGVGVSRGSPDGHNRGSATYTLDFGTRR